MDRDLAQSLITILTAIKTAIETIATNTTPADDGGDPPADGGGDA